MQLAPSMSPRDRLDRRRQGAGSVISSLTAVLDRQLIREYTEADRTAIIEVWFAASVIATPFLSAEFLAEEREKIRTIWLSRAETWVYEIDGDVIGFVSLIGNEVGALFVCPDAQGGGVGKALMDHAASLHDELILDVFEDNAAGRRFYDRYGFEFEFKHVHEPSGHMQLRLSFSPEGNKRSSRKG